MAPDATCKQRPFSVDEVVLADWGGKLYYAKILSINYRRSRCLLLFDDGTSESVSFSKVHSVNETTTDIVCVACKEDATTQHNDIVLCDSCSIGFHQKCHKPFIPEDALDFDTPWHCTFCMSGAKNPHIEENPFSSTEGKNFPKKRVSNKNNSLRRSAEQPLNGEQKEAKGSLGLKEFSMNKKHDGGKQEVLIFQDNTLEHDWRKRPSLVNPMDQFNMLGSRACEDSIKTKGGSLKHHREGPRNKIWQATSDSLKLYSPNTVQASQLCDGRPLDNSVHEDRVNVKHGRGHTYNKGRMQGKMGRHAYKGSLRERMTKRYNPMGRPSTNAKRSSESLYTNNNCYRNKHGQAMQFVEDEPKVGRLDGVVVEQGLREEQAEEEVKKKLVCIPSVNTGHKLKSRFSRIEGRQEQNATWPKTKANVNSMLIPSCKESTAVLLSEDHSDGKESHWPKERKRPVASSALSEVNAPSEGAFTSAFSFTTACLSERLGSMDKHRSELKADYKKFRSKDIGEGQLQCKHSDANTTFLGEDPVPRPQSFNAIKSSKDYESKGELDLDAHSHALRTNGDANVSCAGDSCLEETGATAQEIIASKGSVGQTTLKDVCDSDKDVVGSSSLWRRNTVAPPNASTEDLQQDANSSNIVEDVVSRSKDDVSRSKDDVSRSKDDVSRSKDGVSRSKDGVSRSKDGVSRSKDVVSRSKDDVSRSKVGVSRSKDGVSYSNKIRNSWSSSGFGGKDQVKRDVYNDESDGEASMEIELAARENERGVEEDDGKSEGSISGSEADLKGSLIIDFKDEYFHPSEISTSKNDHPTEEGAHGDERVKHKCLGNNLTVQEYMAKDSFSNQGSLHRSTGDKLIMECNENGRKSLGIRISDVFSLKSGSSPAGSALSCPVHDVSKTAPTDRLITAPKTMKDVVQAANESFNDTLVLLNVDRKQKFVSNDSKEGPSSETKCVTMRSKKAEERTQHASEKSVEISSEKRNLETLPDGGRPIKSKESFPQTEPHSNSEHVGKKRIKKVRPNVSSPVSGNIFGRISLDLPRHNWLIERLVNERKLGSDDLQGENRESEEKGTEKKPRRNRRKRRLSSKGRSSDGDGRENRVAETNADDVIKDKGSAEEAKSSEEDATMLEGSDCEKVKFGSLNLANEVKDGALRDEEDRTSCGERQCSASNTKESQRKDEEFDKLGIEKNIRQEVWEDSLKEKIDSHDSEITVIKANSENEGLMKKECSVTSLTGDQETGYSLQKEACFERVKKDENNSALKVPMPRARLDHDTELTNKNKLDGEFEEIEIRKPKPEILFATRQGKSCKSAIVLPYSMKRKAETNELSHASSTGKCDSEKELDCEGTRPDLKYTINQLKSMEQQKRDEKSQDKHQICLYREENEGQKILAEASDLESVSTNEESFSSSRNKRQSMLVSTICANQVAIKEEKLSPETNEPSHESLSQGSKNELLNSLKIPTKICRKEDVNSLSKSASSKQDLNRMKLGTVLQEMKAQYDGYERSSPDYIARNKRYHFGITNDKEHIDVYNVGLSGISNKTNCIDAAQVAPSDIGYKCKEDIFGNRPVSEKLPFDLKEKLVPELGNPRHLAPSGQPLHVETNFREMAKCANVSRAVDTFWNRKPIIREETPIKRQRIGIDSSSSDARNYNNNPHQRSSSEGMYDMHKTVDNTSPTLDSKAATILSIIKDDSISASTKKELLAYWKNVKTESVVNKKSIGHTSGKGAVIFESVRGRKSHVSPFRPSHDIQGKEEESRSRLRSDSVAERAIRDMYASPKRNERQMARQQSSEELRHSFPGICEDQSLLKLYTGQQEVTRKRPMEKTQGHAEDTATLDVRERGLNLVQDKKAIDPMTTIRKHWSRSITDMGLPLPLDSQKTGLVYASSNGHYKPCSKKSLRLDGIDNSLMRRETSPFPVQQQSPIEKYGFWSADSTAKPSTVKEEQGIGRPPSSDMHHIPRHQHDPPATTMFHGHEAFRINRDAHLLEKGVPGNHGGLYGNHRVRESFVEYHGLDRHYAANRSPQRYDQRHSFREEFDKKYEQQQHKQQQHLKMMLQPKLQMWESEKYLELREFQNSCPKAAPQKFSEQLQFDFTSQQKHSSSSELQQDLQNITHQQQHQQELSRRHSNSAPYHFPRRYPSMSPQSPLESFQPPFPMFNNKPQHAKESQGRTKSLPGVPADLRTTQHFRPIDDSKNKRARNPVCQFCESTAKFLCSRCRNAWYCSERCQVKDWTVHGKRCIVVSKQA